MSLPCSSLSSTLQDSATHEVTLRKDVGLHQRDEAIVEGGTGYAPSVVTEDGVPEVSATASRSEVGGTHSTTQTSSSLDGAVAASPGNASSVLPTSQSSFRFTTPRGTSTRPRVFPMPSKRALGLSNQHPPGYPHLGGIHTNGSLHPQSLVYETLGDFEPLTPINPGGAPFFGGHQSLHQQPCVPNELAVPSLISMHTCAPLATLFPMSGDGDNTCAYAHSPWQQPIQMHPLSFSQAAALGPSPPPWGMPHASTWSLHGDASHAQPFLWSEQGMAPIDPASSEAMLCAYPISQDASQNQVGGEASILGDISAQPVALPSVAVFAGGAQEAFWRRSCLRVTCIPVSSTLHRDGEGAPEVLGIAREVPPLGQSRDSVRANSCSGSHSTGDIAGEELDALVWRWLDTLGMSDAVEEVILPGADRVLVLWTPDLACEPNKNKRDAGEATWKSSAPGERLAQILRLSSNGKNGIISDVFDAPYEVVFGAMRLLLD